MTILDILGSQVATGHQLQDDDASSLSTKAGGEMNIPGASFFGRSSTEHTTRKTGYVHIVYYPWSNELSPRSRHKVV